MRYQLTGKLSEFEKAKQTLRKNGLESLLIGLSGSGHPSGADHIAELKIDDSERPIEHIQDFLRAFSGLNISIEKAS